MKTEIPVVNNLCRIKMDPDYINYVVRYREKLQKIEASSKKVTEQDMINRSNDLKIIQRYNTPCYSPISFQERLALLR